MDDILMAVLIDEDIDSKVSYLTADENSCIRYNRAIPMSVQMSYGSDAMGLDYAVKSFTVDVGNQKLITGYYPCFTSNGSPVCFGGLMLKVNDKWYCADFVNPAESTQEVVAFKPMLSLQHAFVMALKMAMENYVKQSA